ncbi:cysteine--tRNA ligase, partial [Patescibacteria group bacterium]|nr:cysteine--tRNA ligase [Patescibacteria group bacterium]
MNSKKVQFYNTLSRAQEDFVPLKDDVVTFYSCGPTVYNYPHIGNYRAYIFADTLKRTLTYLGYNVRHIMNLTDIDDKTIRESQKEGKSLKEFTEFYSNEFFKDIKTLNILPPEKFTKATDYIPEMVEIIKTLLEKGIAYKSADGSVYYDIKKFPLYGKLSHIDLSAQKENASGRIVADEYEKDNAQDFALWKAWDEKDGDVFWDTPLGKGRPGWHIECSAMSMKNLGEQIDLHTGGVDNMFPHHENEIAQSEGATGKQFVKYWMHNEWVLVDQKKMAKSEKNFYTLKDLTDKNINPLAYRLWLLMAHYRTRVNFVWEALLGTETALKRLYSLYMSLGEAIGAVDEKYQGMFQGFVADDLDTPRAVALLFDIFKDDKLSNENKKATILDFDKVLGLGFAELRNEMMPEEVLKLVNAREDARK